MLFVRVLRRRCEIMTLTMKMGLKQREARNEGWMGWRGHGVGERESKALAYLNNLREKEEKESTRR